MNNLRQDFFTKYIPRILSLGLTIPDSTIHFDEENKHGFINNQIGTNLRKLLKIKVLVHRHDSNLRRTSYENNAWVREALAAVIN